jgi:hypothetical protein
MGSLKMSPTVMRGLSDAYGSWNTICMRRRSGRIAEAEAPAISCPAKRIDPAVGSWMRTTRRAKVDLPQPDSPTTPTVSPAATSRSTPSTARTTFFAPEEAVAAAGCASPGRAPTAAAPRFQPVSFLPA